MKKRWHKSININSNFPYYNLISIDAIWRNKKMREEIEKIRVKTPNSEKKISVSVFEKNKDEELKEICGTETYIGGEDEVIIFADDKEYALKGVRKVDIVVKGDKFMEE